MRLEWLEPGNEAGLREWDDFQSRSVRGHYCQLSTWLGSFEPYGFRFAVLVARREASGTVLGGIGVLRLGRGSFGVMRAPVGPIVEVGAEHLVQPILEALLERAERTGVFLLQLQFPCSQEVHLDALLPSVPLPDRVPHYPGRRFPAAGAPNQILWIGFENGRNGTAGRDDLLARFTPGARRHIRRAEQQGLYAHEVTQESDLREAYRLIEENGRQQGYSTRAWSDFGPVMLRQVQLGQGVMLVAQHRGRPVAAHYAILAGRRYCFLMGGTRRDDPKLNAGHFLHWSAILRAKELGLLGYDFTSGGPPGVLQFKMGFRPQVISFISPEYYVLSRWRSAAFFAVTPWLRKHKQLVSRVLGATTRWLPKR